MSTVTLESVSDITSGDDDVFYFNSDEETDEYGNPKEGKSNYFISDHIYCQCRFG